jgi:TRAP-type C4-dicarboxylate transport system substrate-binding protein
MRNQLARGLLALALALAGMVPAGLVGAAEPAPPSLTAGPKLTINSVTQSLPSLPQYAIELDYFQKRIPAWSHDRVTFHPSTWAESAVNGSDILRLVSQGQIDVGASPMATVAGDLPLLEVADLAGLSPKVDQAKKVAGAIMNDANERLKRYGVKMIASYPFPANFIFCRAPLKSLTDLKGRKVRTFGPSQNDLVATLGGQPVNIGFPEVYQALATGVADCAITATTSALASKWFEVTHYIYDLPISWGTGGYYVNLRWWNGLAPDVRTFLEQSFKLLEDSEWRFGDQGSAQGLACATGDAAGCKGKPLSGKDVMTVIAPQPEDVSKLQTILKTVIVPKWVSRCGANCGPAFNRDIAPVVGFSYEAK